MVTSRNSTQWQLREGTLLLAMFRENDLRLARYSSQIHSTVSGARCFSADLPQGGLQVPCMYDFSLEKIHACTTPFLHGLTH